MYDELIKALRHCGDSHSGCSTCSYRSKTEDCMGKLCFDSADAIERLQAECKQKGGIIKDLSIRIGRLTQ